MSYISVAQYASYEDTKKTASMLKQPFFVSSRKGFMRLCRLFQSFRV